MASVEAFRDTIYKTIRARGFGLVIVIVTSALKTARSLVKDTCWRYYMHIGRKTPNCPVRSARTDLNILSRRQGIRELLNLNGLSAHFHELRLAIVHVLLRSSVSSLRAEKNIHVHKQPCSHAEREIIHNLYSYPILNHTPGISLDGLFPLRPERLLV